jgi:coatomer subunit delta
VVCVVLTVSTEQRIGGHRGEEAQSKTAGDTTKGGGPQCKSRHCSAHPLVSGVYHKYATHCPYDLRRLQCSKECQVGVLLALLSFLLISYRPMAVRNKGMMLGKKSKTGTAYDQIKGELGPEADMAAPLVPQQATAVSSTPATPTTAQPSDREAVHIIIAENITAEVTREGGVKSFDVKGDLQLKITDPSLTQLKLKLTIGDSKGAQLMAHPKVDKALFRNQRIIQIAQAGQGFPKNQSIGVMKWKLTPRASEVDDAPLNFSVWVNESGSNTWNVTVEYEWNGGEPLRDVVVSIPFATDEPSISSFDAVYEVSGDSVDWTIGAVDDSNPSGSFEFEAQASDEADFFPMNVQFSKTKPYVDIDVSGPAYITAHVVNSSRFRPLLCLA